MTLEDSAQGLIKMSGKRCGLLAHCRCCLPYGAIAPTNFAIRCRSNRAEYKGIQNLCNFNELDIIIIKIIFKIVSKEHIVF